MPCLKVALTAVDKAFGNQVTIRRALQNQTRTETHHQYLNLLMLTVDSLPSADLKSLQTYLGPCPAAVSRNNFWPAVEVHTSLYQFWCPWHMNFIQITELFKKMNPKDFVSRNQWSMHLNHKVGEGMQRWCCGRKVRQTSNATTAREVRTNGKGDVSWTRTWWISFADLIDMYLCTHAKISGYIPRRSAEAGTQNLQKWPQPVCCLNHSNKDSSYRWGDSQQKVCPLPEPSENLIPSSAICSTCPHESKVSHIATSWNAFNSGQRSFL